MKIFGDLSQLDLILFLGLIFVCPLPLQSGAGDMEMPGVHPKYVVSTLKIFIC
jgi:hypothetical protein